VTFTNKAAAEMRERLGKIIDEMKDLTKTSSSAKVGDTEFLDD